IVLANNSDPNNTHPYWYTHIIGLFHADIQYNDPEGDFEDWKVFCVDFAWVWWYGFNSKHCSGFKAKRPHHVGFLQGTNPEAFGFFNPNKIIQAVYLIPIYKLGWTAEFLPPSIT
ncbi:hypothetical protein IW262DRAFT_1282379, partial [Armillaria fumosa]